MNYLLFTGYQNKKLQSPPNEEMELSQRTGQFSIVFVLGRGTPLFIKANLPCCKGCVKDAMHGAGEKRCGETVTRRRGVIQLAGSSGQFWVNGKR